MQLVTVVRDTKSEGKFSDIMVFSKFCVKSGSSIKIL